MTLNKFSRAKVGGGSVKVTNNVKTMKDIKMYAYCYCYTDFLLKNFQKNLLTFEKIIMICFYFF